MKKPNPEKEAEAIAKRLVRQRRNLAHLAAGGYHRPALTEAERDQLRLLLAGETGP